MRLRYVHCEEKIENETNLTDCTPKLTKTKLTQNNLTETHQKIAKLDLG
jgi:hypothetical protein